jgi:hypothetical protein
VITQDGWQGGGFGPGSKRGLPVAQSVLAMGMGVEPCMDGRPAWRAGWRGAKCLCKNGSLFGERVHHRGLDDRIAIAARNRTPIISDQEKDVFLQGGTSSLAGGELAVKPCREGFQMTVQVRIRFNKS